MLKISNEVVNSIQKQISDVETKLNHGLEELKREMGSNIIVLVGSYVAKLNICSNDGTGQKTLTFAFDAIRVIKDVVDLAKSVESFLADPVGTLADWLGIALVDKLECGAPGCLGTWKTWQEITGLDGVGTALNDISTLSTQFDTCTSG